MNCMNYDLNKYFGLFKFRLGYSKKIIKMQSAAVRYG